MNTKMRELVTNSVQANILSPDLAEILDAGFVERDGCIVLAEEANKTTRNASMDAIGYESFVNHLHIKSFSMALLFANDLASALGRAFVERFVVILSFDGDTATVRFHKDRLDKTWLDVSELENFKDEAVGVLYSS